MLTLKECEELITDNYKKIYKYCLYKLSLNEALADEVTSDVFMIFMQKRKSLKKADKLEVWFYRTAKNCVNRKLRELAKNKTVELDEKIILQAHDEAYLIGTEFDYTEKTPPDKAKVISEILSALPHDMGALFEMRYINKKTLSEISKETGIPYSTVRLRLLNAEKTAREIIHKMFTY